MAKHLDLEEQEQIEQLRHFWRQWGRPVCAALLLVALCALGWFGYRQWHERQALQAAALFDSFDGATRAGDLARSEQVFADLQDRFAASAQTAQAGLALARILHDAGQADGAHKALTAVAQQAGDPGLKALAKLRLASVLIEQNDNAGALAQLGGSFPPEFAALVADRRGDILQLLKENRQDVIAEYSKAYQGLGKDSEYRGLVEIKLNALGVAPQAGPAASVSTAQEP